MVSYVILLKTPAFQITIPEFYVLIYIITFGVEILRSMALSTPCTLWGKVKNWHSKYWNLFDTMCVILYFIGFFLRCYGMCKCGWYSNVEKKLLGKENPSCDVDFYSHSVTKEEYVKYGTLLTWKYNSEIKRVIGYGRAIYCLDTSLWFIRVFKFCSVNKTLGNVFPYFHFDIEFRSLRYHGRKNASRHGLFYFVTRHCALIFWHCQTSNFRYTILYQYINSRKLVNGSLFKYFSSFHILTH